MLFWFTYYTILFGVLCLLEILAHFQPVDCVYATVYVFMCVYRIKYYKLNWRSCTSAEHFYQSIEMTKNLRIQLKITAAALFLSLEHCLKAQTFHKNYCAQKKKISGGSVDVLHLSKLMMWFFFLSACVVSLFGFQKDKFTVIWEQVWEI